MTSVTTSSTDSHSRFTELLRQHQPIILKVAGTYCWHTDDRAELSQEIVTQLWRAFAQFDDNRKFSTWMYRIALNVAISFVRSNTLRQRHIVAMDEQLHDMPDQSISNGVEDERIELLYRLIDQLNSLDRALLLLYLEERSYREIADILGITETNVATKINRLKQRIRRQSTPGKRSQYDDRSNHHGTG